MLSGSGEAEANQPAGDTMHAAAAPASEGCGGAQSGESEFTFIVLTSGGERDAGVAFATESARQKLTAQGTPAKMRSLMPEDSEFAATVAKHAVTSFPAVIAVSGDGAAALIEGEIDETRLLKAYLASCAPASGCGEATGAGCPPGACGK